MNQIVTIYIGDLKNAISKLRNQWGAGSTAPMGTEEAAWMRGYNAACNEIDLAIRDLPAYVAEVKDD